MLDWLVQQQGGILLPLESHICSSAIWFIMGLILAVQGGSIAFLYHMQWTIIDPPWYRQHSNCNELYCQTLTLTSGGSMYNFSFLMNICRHMFPGGYVTFLHPFNIPSLNSHIILSSWPYIILCMVIFSGTVPLHSHYYWVYYSLPFLPFEFFR